MKAVCWMGRNTVQVEDVPEPQILNRGDAIVRVTSTAICGSDLHLYNGYVPGMMEGDILGVRLTQAQLRNRMPGRGLTVDLRSGELINVQIPETTLD